VVRSSSGARTPGGGRSHEAGGKLEHNLLTRDVNQNVSPSKVLVNFARVQHLNFNLNLGPSRRRNTRAGILHTFEIALKHRRGYIEVDDQLRTNVPGIWAMGDCNGRGAFTHTSYNDFEIVAANVLDNEQRRVSDRIPAYALFTDPPLGRVGMTEAEVRKTGRSAVIATVPMESLSRPLKKARPRGS
jgi:hypothetical protein